MKNKLLSILLIGVLAITITGCGNSTKNGDNNSNTKNETTNTESTKTADTITCRELGDSPQYEKKENIFKYKDGKLYQWLYQKTTFNDQSTGDVKTYCGEANTNSYGRITIVEGNTCYYLFDLEKMTDEEISNFTMDDLIERSIDEEFEKLKDDMFLTCTLGESEVKLNNPKAIEGTYEGINNYLDSNSNYKLSHDEIKIEFKNGNYSYTINNDNFSGTYTYDGKNLVLNSENEESKKFGNQSLTDKGEFVVYTNLDGYDILITDNVGHKVLKLNKN